MLAGAAALGRRRRRERRRAGRRRGRRRAPEGRVSRACRRSVAAGRWRSGGGRRFHVADHERGELVEVEWLGEVGDGAAAGGADGNIAGGGEDEDGGRRLV